MPTPHSSTLVYLQQLFPDVIMIDTRALAMAIGIAPKTINNLGDNFPIPAVRFGRNKFFRLIDAASYIDNALGISAGTAIPPQSLAAMVDAAPPAKRGRGRPRKVAAGASA